MKSVSMLTWLLATLALPAAATLGANPYSGIVDRNPFGLLPPPAPVSIEVAAPPSNVKLTGISTLFGGKKAMLMVTEGGAGKLPTYMSLVEGEQNGQITCTEINVEDGVVKIKNAGRNETLNFKDNGLTSAPTPISQPAAQPPGGQPGNVPAPGAPVPGAGGVTTIGGNAGGAAPAPSNGGLRQIPSRPTRGGRGVSTVAPQGSANVADEAAAAAIILEHNRANQPAGQPPLPPALPGVQEALGQTAQ
jgi:hypothetical protein